MTLRCPGRESNAKLDSEMVPCPGCGRLNEMFGDEQKVHCRCGVWVFRDVLPSCAQWCPAAAECFGDIKGFVPPTANKGHSCSSEEFERFKELQALVLDKLACCRHPEHKKAAAPRNADGA